MACVTLVNVHAQAVVNTGMLNEKKKKKERNKERKEKKKKKEEVK